MKAECERLRAQFTEYNAKYFGGRLDYGIRLTAGSRRLRHGGIVNDWSLAQDWNLTHALDGPGSAVYGRTPG